MANPSFSYLPKWEKVDKICVDAKQKTEQFQNSVQTQKQYIKCHGFISFFSCFLILTSNIPIPIRIRNIFKWLEIQEYYQKKIETFPFFSFRRAIKFCTNWKHIHRRCLCMGFWCYRWLSNAFCFCNTLATEPKLNWKCFALQRCENSMPFIKVKWLWWIWYGKNQCCVNNNGRMMKCF